MKCPGQDTRYWKPGDIFEVDCPNCGQKVEFFKDEASRKCRNCKEKVMNPKMDFGCASYCQYAAECLGELGPELLAKRDDLLKDRIALGTKRRLGQDFQRIAHAVKVARHAEEIAREEKVEPAIVLCASHLHVLGEGRGEGPDAPRDQEAREVLEQAGAQPEMITRVLDLIGQTESEDRGESASAKVFSDAHLLASIEERLTGRTGAGDVNAEEMKQKCLTETGRRLATKLLAAGER
jgi:hypothetical protein